MCCVCMFACVCVCVCALVLMNNAIVYCKCTHDYVRSGGRGRLQEGGHMANNCDGVFGVDLCVGGLCVCRDDLPNK